MLVALTRFALLAALVLACSAPPAVLSPAPAPPALPAPAALPIPTGDSISARLTHAAADSWVVDYALPAPVTAIAFRRGRIPRDNWRIVDPPGATLVDRFVVSPTPFQRMRIALPTGDHQPDKEYRPFYRYADGGLLAYTGQVLLSRAVCSSPSGSCPDGRGLSSGDDYGGTLTLVASAGERVVVYGRSPVPETSIPMSHDGTYAYFGDLAPVETPGFVGVLDRGMPAWIRARISTDLPRLFDRYARRLGPLNDPKPTLFVTFATRAHGMSIGGGVLEPHVMTLDVELDSSRLGDGSGARLDIDRLVAHEAAHFWNAGEHAGRGDPGGAWMHEGGADALAARALHAAGALDDDAYRSVLSEAASECALWLSGGEPLAASSRPGHARAFYVCGSTLSLVAEAALRRHDASADLFTFWREVFDEGKPAYDETTFLHVLDRLGGDPAVTEGVRRLVHERQDDPTRALRDLLRRAGIETTPLAQPPWPDDYEQHASIPEMDALLPSACARALDFDGDIEVRPSVGADGACPGLARGDVIDAVAGVPVGPSGATSLQRAFAACTTGRREVEVTTARQAHVALPCELQTQVAPSYFELVR